MVGIFFQSSRAIEAQDWGVRWFSVYWEVSAPLKPPFAMRSHVMEEDNFFALVL